MQPGRTRAGNLHRLVCRAQTLYRSGPLLLFVGRRMGDFLEGGTKEKLWGLVYISLPESKPSWGLIPPLLSLCSKEKTSWGLKCSVRGGKRLAQGDGCSLSCDGLERAGGREASSLRRSERIALKKEEHMQMSGFGSGCDTGKESSGWGVGTGKQRGK